MQWVGVAAEQRAREAEAELAALRSRLDAAPLGTVTSFDSGSSWQVAKLNPSLIYPTLRFKRVRLVMEE